MGENKQIELIPGDEITGKSVFKSEEEYEAFRLRFYDDVKPALDRWDQARKKSEEQARQGLSR